MNCLLSSWLTGWSFSDWLSKRPYIPAGVPVGKTLEKIVRNFGVSGFPYTTLTFLSSRNNATDCLNMSRIKQLIFTQHCGSGQRSKYSKVTPLEPHKQI